MQQVTYKRYLIIMLMIIYAFNFVDRQVLALVMNDIKVELDLSDSQLGLMTGIAFALFYSVMGIPIARWADRGNRVTIISLTTALWSAMVALSAFTTSFLQLLLVRIGVAVGEAGCVPPAHSLIAENFSRSERPRAVAIYMMGGPVSVMIGYFIGGWLNQYVGWRMTFALLAIPGLLIALIALFTIRESRASGRYPAGGKRITNVERSPSLKEVFSALWRLVTLRHLILAFSLVQLFGYGAGIWIATYFIRFHGMETGELGTWLAAIWGIGGAIGAYLGGAVASRYAPGNERLQLQVVSLCFVALLPTMYIYITPERSVALALMTVTALILLAFNGPIFAVIQTLVQERMRATAIALVYFVANLIGMGLGPLTVGVLSDILMPALGQESLRYAMVIAHILYLWAAFHFWRAGRVVSAELSNARLEDDAETAVTSPDRNTFTPMSPT